MNHYKNPIASYHPGLFVLLETKIFEQRVDWFHRQFSPSWNFFVIPAIGRSGSIIALWDSTLGLVSFNNLGRQAIFVTIGI